MPSASPISSSMPFDSTTSVAPAAFNRPSIVFTRARRELPPNMLV